MTSVPAATWSSYGIVSTLRLLPEKSLPLKTPLCARLASITCEMCCSSLPLVCFSLSECNRRVEGLGLFQDRERYWRAAKNKAGRIVLHAGSSHFEGLNGSICLFWWHSVIIQSLRDNVTQRTLEWAHTLNGFVAGRAGCPTQRCN